MAGNQNSGGKSLVSKELTARVRKLTLLEIEKALLGEDSDFKKQVILRLAGTVLPRLMEHTGEDGGNILITQMIYGERNSNTPPLHSAGLPTADTPSDTKSEV